MIKQAYEDILRHRLDDKVNDKKVLILKDNIVETFKCKDISCGDIVRVNENSTVPCDMLLLHSSNTNKTCYVTTANLDGESNLKIKQESVDDCSLLNEESVNNFRGVVVCDRPSAQMYDFKGKIITKNREL
jgi:P-type E1-E2 ATPase